MSKYDESIEKIILLGERLEQQSEQEKAMVDVMPARFEQNISAFRHLLPSLMLQFENYTPERSFEFFCTDNGEPNLKWLDSDDVLYPESPYAFCKDQIEFSLKHSAIYQYDYNITYDAFHQYHLIYLNRLAELQRLQQKDLEKIDSIPDSMSTCMMFGLGLGYQLGYLYERCSVANLFIFEPSKDLFYASLYTFDWAPLLKYLHEKNVGLHFFIGQSSDEIKLELMNVINPKRFNTFLSSNVFGFTHYKSDELIKIRSVVENNFYHLGMGWGFFDDNLFAMSHSKYNLENKKFLLKNKKVPNDWLNVPVCVVGNGPSLDDAISFLKENHPKTIIIACGTAISSLAKANIKPDFYVATERVDVVPKSLESIDKKFLSGVVLLSTDVLHPDTHAFFDESVLAIKADEAMFSLLVSNTYILHDFLAISHVNPLVGNIGVSIPLHLGFKQIYLFGLDNGYRDDSHHHSKLSLYYNDDGETKDHFKGMALANADKMADANFGGFVKTNKLFLSSISMMESVISLFKESNCFNCSNGAKITGAMPLHVSDIDFSHKINVNKGEFKNILTEQLSSTTNISPDFIASLFDVDFFDTFIEKLKSEWNSLPVTRFELVQMMQQQCDYLKFIHESKQSHIAHVLSGTLNTIYSLITTFIYRIKDESTAIRMLDQQKEIILELLDIMKEKYQHGLNYVQGRHI